MRNNTKVWLQVAGILFAEIAILLVANQVGGDEAVFFAFAPMLVLNAAVIFPCMSTRLDW